MTLALLAAAMAACPSGVAIEGSPLAAGELQQALAIRGLAPADPGCALVVAAVEESSDGLSLSLRDAAGRTAVRRVSRPDVAVALVESWARGDLDQSLLVPPRRVPALPAPAPSPGWTASPSVLAEVSLGQNGSHFEGARIEGVVSRPGLLLPLAAVGIGSGAPVAAELAAATQLRADALGGVRLRLVALPIEPSLAAGIRWSRTWRARASCPSAGCTRPLVPDGASETAIDALVEAGVAVDLALLPTLRGRFLISGRALPFAPSGPRVPGYAAGLGGAASSLGLPRPDRLELGLAAGLSWERP